MTRHDEWAAAQRTTTVTVDGHDLDVAYHESGSTDGDAPVVFLHGIPTWSFLWRDIVSAVNDERRAIAPDLLGYGNSSMHDGFDRSIRAQEAMVEQLVDSLPGDSVSIVAHDIGGGVALRYASHNPETVDRLVLSNAVCYDSWPVEFVSELGLPKAASADELNAKLDYAFGDGLHGEPDEEFVEGMKSPWQSAEARTSLRRNAVATNTNHTTELDYGAIDAETLLLWGADDVLQSIDYAERLTADIASADIVPLENAFHWVVQDRTDAYREHVRSFLTETNRVE